MRNQTVRVALTSILFATATVAAPALAASDPLPADATAGTTDTAPPAATPAAIATGLLDQLDAGDYAGAESRFDARMSAAVPAAKLKELWESLPGQVGAATGRGEPSVSVADGMQLAQILLHYENGELLAQVAIDPEGKVVGFLIKPAPPKKAAAPAADASFTEQPFPVGASESALPGTLAMPKAPADSNGYPAVVMVHGSGPQDRDETIGRNRPFLDISRGLAAHGIAVLRYDKRTLVRPQDFRSGDYDVDDETTDDAVQAVAALRSTEGIDPARIYVLGHSQGGMLAPRIARKAAGADTPVAGLVVLAAPSRPLLDLLPEQNRYLLDADGGIDKAGQDFLDDLDAKIAKVRSSAEMASEDTPLGVPASYWRHFDTIDPVADAVASHVPMLLLQGGRDFQVVDTDWQLWHRALDGNSDATLKHYPALNHLGVAGTGPSSLAEYQQPGHVDTALISDIAAWINPPSAQK